MGVTNEMPEVAACDVIGCAYNREARCHARAITVGSSSHAKCETFVHSGAHAGEPAVAGVGACKAVGCRHNQDFECQAPSIRVGGHGRHADCLTFSPLK